MSKSLVIRPVPFLLNLLLSLGGGTIIGFLTQGSEKYDLLTQPPLSPPPVVFVIAWAVLYTLMAVSATLVGAGRGSDREGALRLYYVQLGVNFLWPVIFFSMGLLTAAFVWILLLIALVGVMIALFYKENRLAAFLQIPYFLWLLFAAYLNLGFVVLN